VDWRKRTVAMAASAIVLARATVADAQSARACIPVTRTNVVACAVAASYALAAETSAKEAAEGRRTAVSPLLPSNPVVSVLGGRRWQGGESGYHWQGSLSQEIEIAGQRGLRRDAAEADVEAQSRRVVARRREVALDAWTAYFDAIAASEEQRLATRLASTAQRVATVARAKAEKGLLAAVDADVAESVSVRVLQVKLGADRRFAAANASLASLLGADGALTIEGELVPLDGVTNAAATRVAAQPDLRPELRALDAQRRAQEVRADAFRRARVPNPTVSVVGETDRFEGKVLAVGIAFPIPIPGNVGRTFQGEIAEAEALARQSAAERERLRRQIRLEVGNARIAFEAFGREVEAFSPDRLSRAEQDLQSLAEELESGRLAVRDAVVAQQALIELLQAHVAARKSWCQASVALAFASGLSLEAAAP
jgi:outer membrane protein, heavy metal efflux system